MSQLSTMRYGPILLFALLGLGAAAPDKTGAVERASSALKPSATEEALHLLVDRQEEIFRAAESAGNDVDLDGVRRKLQVLANDYEAFLRRNPEYGPAFAAYGLMLGRTSMRTESAAALAKADRLLRVAYADESARTPAFLKTWALVKNQLGNYVAEEGQPLDAATLFLDAIELVPKEPLYHFQLGNLLHEARDDFLKSGQWSREKTDRAMLNAFRTASELAPQRVEFGLRYGQSYYDVEKPDWDAALKVWAQLEEKADSQIERETMRLHAANVLIKQGKLDHARAILASIEQLELQKRKAEVLAEANGEGK